MKKTIKTSFIWIPVFCLILFGFIIHYGLKPRILPERGDQFSTYEKLLEQFGKPPVYSKSLPSNGFIVEYFDRYILPKKGFRIYFDKTGNLEMYQLVDHSKNIWYLFPGYRKIRILAWFRDGDSVGEVLSYFFFMSFAVSLSVFQYIVLFWFGFLSKNKGYGFWPAFFGSMFLCGLLTIIVLKTKPYRCRRCNMAMNKEESTYRCPSCGDRTTKSFLGQRVLTIREINANPKEVDLTVNISPAVKKELTEKYALKTNEELKSILAKKEEGHYSERAYRVMEMIVRQRATL